MMNLFDPADRLAFLQKNKIRDVECIFADISGYPRGKLMPAAKFAAGDELRIAQAIPMQAITGEYSYHPVFPDADPDLSSVGDAAKSQSSGQDRPHNHRTHGQPPSGSILRSYGL